MNRKNRNKLSTIFLGALVFLTLAFAALPLLAVDLSWQTATQREDNTALGLSEIQLHNIYCGPAIGDYSYPRVVHPGATLPDTFHTGMDLPGGTHYCVITTVDIDSAFVIADINSNQV